MKKQIFLISCIFIIILSFQVSAFGATPPYWNDRPLILSPGEEKIVPIILQNMVGNEDIILKTEILSGKEIASFIDSNENQYTVPLGKKDVRANLKIQIPKTAKKGDKYQVALTFKNVPKDKEKMLQLTNAVTASFPVIIEASSQEFQESPKQSKNKPILFSIILVILIAIILVIVMLILIIRNNKSKDF